MRSKGLPSFVADNEWLARFVLFSRWVRADLTIKPDAFIPHPYPDLSVTRHLGLSGSRLWQVGQEIAASRPAKLLGRADIDGSSVRNAALEVVPKPTKNNPNHANVVSWPSNKAEQKIIAQKLAAAAQYKGRDT